MVVLGLGQNRRFDADMGRYLRLGRPPGAVPRLAQICSSVVFIGIGVVGVSRRIPPAVTRIQVGKTWNENLIHELSPTDDELSAESVHSFPTMAERFSGIFLNLSTLSLTFGMREPSDGNLI